MTHRPWSNQYGCIWTDAEDAALRKHLFNGLSSSVAAAEINKEFGTNYTRNAVIGRAVRNKMPRGSLQTTKLKAKRDSPWKAENISERQYYRRKKMKPKPPEFKCDEARLRSVDVVPLHLPLLELTESTCHWPFGEGEVSTVVYSFCGHQVYGATPYCASHFGLSLRNPA